MERQRHSFALLEGRPLASTKAFASGLRPAGGEASGLQPSGVDSPTLSPAIPSLPLSLPPSLLPSGLQRCIRPAAGLRRRPSVYVGLRHAIGFASDRALAIIWQRYLRLSESLEMCACMYVCVWRMTLSM